MGFLTNIFKKKEIKVAQGAFPFFVTLDGYTPVFSTFDGGVYEMELTRACIHTFASHCSKLEPNVRGADLRGLQAILDHKPNPFETSAQFLYKAATIYEAQNTVYIVPIIDDYDDTVGYYPVSPRQVEFKDVKGEPWIVFTFGNGEKGAVEWKRCGMVPKFLYHSDLHGESNLALMPTMQLLNTQNQGIENGIKNGARFRFMAESANILSADDLEKNRKKFVQNNMSESDGGLIVFPSDVFKNPKQINSEPKLVDPEQMKLIENRVYTYFGSSENILQNKAVGDEWSGYYEGKVEPFAIQLSQALTCMTFTEKEIARGNEIMFSANRLQYMSDKAKLEFSTAMFDRGIASTNTVMDVWNMPHVPDGDKRFIRKEYMEVREASDDPETLETIDKEAVEDDTERQDQV
ncbi:MAG: phage portal protein [Clostridia bacterium]|nr:phage portal protein [Clostridia bacterium]